MANDVVLSGQTYSGSGMGTGFGHNALTVAGSDGETRAQWVNMWVDGLAEMQARIEAVNPDGYAIVYEFSTTTTDVDPGDGMLRLDAATQSSATLIMADLKDVNGVDVTGLLDLTDDSTSDVKGVWRLQAISDPDAWMAGTVTALAFPAGYRKLTVAVLASSSASPFSAGDMVILSFTPKGDKGEQGDPGGVSGGNLSGALNEASATVASAGTADIGGAGGNTITITGTTTITALGTAQAGAQRRVTFAGALTLTHNAVSLILPGGASIATEAGDSAEFVSLGSGAWRCTSYTRASTPPYAPWAPAQVALFASFFG
ncbi:hypothetical protein [Azospirillum sp. ST 5-10]|uniref:hypothetical protein n=1 Tax=unclassified Azospirillum TaxID=2630922 RepID=UPI003F49BDE9